MSATVAPAAAWRPTATLATAEQRAAMLAQARDYFARRQVLEIDVPILTRAAVSDPDIESVSAHLQLDPSAELFLHTSPEFAMKRLLCAGFPDVYAICKVFRDGESGRRHLPEFTLIEWYRRDFDLPAIIDDTLAFIAALIAPERLQQPPTRYRYRDAFREFAGLDPLHASLAELQRVADGDASLQASLGQQRDSWLDLLLATRVAPGFAADRLTVVSHYPASQAALARITPGDDGVADRFEVFFGALELANGYVELTDAAEQRARCAGDQSRRRATGRPLRPLDQRFLAALDAGLPACAGVAAGFERLLMVNTQTDDIRQLQNFAVS